MNTPKYVIVIISILLIYSLGSYSGLNTGEDNIEIYNTLYLYPDPITIDGVMSGGEWDNAVNVTKWYMDADPENYDGYNYMYLTEDRDNVYIAIDLVSDQTNDESGEWVGIWLNTNGTVSPDTYPNAQTWYDALNKGMESLLFDVDNNQKMPFFDHTSEAKDTEYSELKDLNGWNPVEGSFEGTIDDFTGGADNNPATMTAVWNGTDYVYRLDIEIPISQHYDMFPELYTEETVRVRVSERISSNITIDNHYFSIRNSTGHLLLDDPEQTTSINTGTSYVYDTHSINEGNFTEDDKILFTYIGVSDVPFKTYFDHFYFQFDYTAISSLGFGTIEYPYSTINDYEIAWTFGPSENNATAHRIFEFKIPKSELEGYTDDTDLGVLLGGYGTLSAFPDTHNWVLSNSTEPGIPYMNSPSYHYYPMPLKSWTFLDDPVLSAIDPNPSDNGSIILDWNDDAGVVNWTVIRHTSMIDEATIDSVDIIAAGLISSTFTDTGLSNGTYYYGIVAVDDIDYLYISNIESVVVNIPAPYTPPDTNTTDTTTTTTTTTPIPPASTTSSTPTDEVTTPGLTFSIAFVAISVAMIYKKRRK